MNCTEDQLIKQICEVIDDDKAIERILYNCGIKECCGGLKTETRVKMYKNACRMYIQFEQNKAK